MELVIIMLMLFVALNCATKLSLWQWWQRFVFSALLAVFVMWSERYAVLQSKTQLADLLQDTVALQNMAVIVTVESAVNFGFCACWFDDAYTGGKNRWWQRALKWFASLLMFPVMFYTLTQTIFAATGVDFGITSLAVAFAALIVLPLLAEAMKRLVPNNDERVELHVLLSCFVCILGLISTVTGKIVYRASDSPMDWPMVAVAAIVFVVLVVLGFIGSRLKWHFINKTSHNT